MDKHKKRLLVIGAGPLQLPAIRKAKEMGLYVAASDMNPEAAGFAFADARAIVSTLDSKGNVAFAKAQKIDGVITLATDAPLVTVAAVADAMKLRAVSPATAKKVTSKKFMKKALINAGVPTPEFRVARKESEALEAAEEIGYPIVTKPFLGSGSRGVVLVSSALEMRDAVCQAQAISGESILIEKLLEGRHLCLEAMVCESKVRILCVVERWVSDPPNFVELLHVYPSGMPVGKQKLAARVAARAIRALGVKDGPCHVDMVYTEEGPVISEVGARLDGDYKSSHMMPLAFDYDIIADTIRIALGEPSCLDDSDETDFLTMRQSVTVAYFKPRLGMLTAIEGVEEAERIPGARYMEFFRKPGEEIIPYRRSHDRAGVVITVGKTRKESIEAARAVLKTVRFQIAGL